MKRAIFHTWDHLQNDFRMGAKLSQFYRRQFTLKTKFSKKYVVLRCLLAPLAYFVAQFKEPISRLNNLLQGDELIAYMSRVGGKFSEIMYKNNCKPDFTQLSPNAREIFG